MSSVVSVCIVGLCLLLAYPAGAQERPCLPGETPVLYGKCFGPAPAGGSGRGGAPSGQPDSGFSCVATCRASDRFCAALAQKITDIGRCRQDAATAQLQNRLSDAGYYYCTQKQSGRAGSPETVAHQWAQTFQPFHPDEVPLYEFAARTARHMVCP
jgi:hypothetical protein